MRRLPFYVPLATFTLGLGWSWLIWLNIDQALLRGLLHGPLLAALLVGVWSLMIPAGLLLHRQQGPGYDPLRRRLRRRWARPSRKQEMVSSALAVLALTLTGAFNPDPLDGLRRPLFLVLIVPTLLLGRLLLKGRRKARKRAKSLS